MAVKDRTRWEPHHALFKIWHAIESPNPAVVIDH